MMSPVRAAPVADFPVLIKRITTTDEGRLQIVLEAQGIDLQTLPQVQAMLELQQGAALLTLQPAQRALFGDDVPPTQASPRPQ